MSSRPLESPSASGGNGVGASGISASNDGAVEGGNGNGGGSSSRTNSLTRKSATALGWSDRFASMPEVQMQVLAEVGKLVRAAARKGDGSDSVQCER